MLNRVPSLKRNSSTNASPNHGSVEKTCLSKCDNTISFESPPKSAPPLIENHYDHRKRPKSLHLELQTIESKSNGTDEEIYLASVDAANFDDSVGFSSLDDIITFPSSSKHLSLSEQITATSSSSIAKLRNLSKKLHKALGVQEDVQIGDHEETESSPLVLATPTSEISGIPSPTVNEIYLERDNSLLTSNEEISSKDITPKSTIDHENETNV